MREVKLRITIKGKVHGVGYRVKLINMALEYGIDRFAVFNVEVDGKQAVMVLVDAPDEIVEIIKKRIEREKPDKAIVESIDFEEYKYDVPPIERCIQAFQMEHWGKAIPIMLDMLEKQDLMLNKMDDMLNKQDLTLSKMDEMLKKQDETIKVIREESEKTRQTVREESEKTRMELKGEIRSVREEITNVRLDLREYMESNLRKIYEEIEEIKKVLKKAGIM